MNEILTDSERDNVIGLIKRNVAKRGTTSVLWAIGEKYPGKAYQREAQKLAAYMCAKDEYLKFPRRHNDKDDWDIELNPHYELNQSIVEANRATKKLYEETLPEVFGGQTTSTNISIGFGIVSFIFIALTAIMQYFDHTEEEVAGIKQQLVKIYTRDSILQARAADSAKARLPIKTNRVDTP